MDFKIENDNVGLLETVCADLNFIIDIENQQENNIFIIPYNKDQHIQVIENTNEIHLTVWEKCSKTIIGFIILAGFENTNMSLELRRIVIQNKGKGLGRQCLKLIKKYCFSRLKFHRLWLDVFDDNVRAINLYESELFQIDGYIRDAIRQGNKYRTLILMSLLENEYFNQTADNVDDSHP